MNQPYGFRALVKATFLGIPQVEYSFISWLPRVSLAAYLKAFSGLLRGALYPKAKTIDSKRIFNSALAFAPSRQINAINYAFNKGLTTLGSQITEKEVA